MATGHCLCGGIEFSVDGELAPIQVCYCKQCQRAQGGPLATNIPVAANAFKILKGQNLLGHFESSPGKRRSFCTRCGSPIYSRRDAIPDIVRVRAGLLDAAPATKLLAHFHVGSKAEWWTIHDRLPQYDAGVAQK